MDDTAAAADVDDTAAAGAPAALRTSGPPEGLGDLEPPATGVALPRTPAPQPPAIPAPSLAPAPPRHRPPGLPRLEAHDRPMPRRRVPGSRTATATYPIARRCARACRCGRARERTTAPSAAPRRPSSAG